MEYQAPWVFVLVFERKVQNFFIRKGETLHFLFLFENIQMAHEKAFFKLIKFDKTFGEI